jgi:hypothetical protein
MDHPVRAKAIVLSARGATRVPVNHASKARIVRMTTRQRDLAVALGSFLILLTVLRGGQERSTPEPVARLRASFQMQPVL